MSATPSWKHILKINGHLLAAGLAGAFAWGFDQIGHGDWVLFKLFAAMFAVTALVKFCQALWAITMLILRSLTWARYKRQGVTPKADTLADQAALRARGLIK